MTALDRIGLAMVKPRIALLLAADRSNAGRAGTDIIALVAVFLVATQLRWIVSAIWLGVAVDPMLGIRAMTHVLTRVLTPELGALVIAAMVVWAASGRRRDLGQAFDVACVAVLPGVVVHMVAQVLVDMSRQSVPNALRWAVDAVAGGWMVVLVVFAIAVCRRENSKQPPIVAATGRRAGLAIAIVALVGMVLQLTWLLRHVDQVRPITDGAIAPPLQLLRIGPAGPSGTPVSFTPGRAAVVDFWATWCVPCLKGMPRLDAFARRHPEVDVFAVNLDDVRAARQLFDEAGYALTLLADDGVASQRYGVTSIPHTVVIDRMGRVRATSHGRIVDLEAEISAVSRQSSTLTRPRLDIGGGGW